MSTTLFSRFLAFCYSKWYNKLATQLNLCKKENTSLKQSCSPFYFFTLNSLTKLILMKYIVAF